MKILNQYDYKPKWTTAFFSGGFFGLCATVFIYLAVSDHRGLIINGLIHLSPIGAKIFYWIFASLSLAFVLAATYIAYMRLSVVQRIAVTADGVYFPAGRWTGHEIHVPFDSITDIKYIEVQKQLFLYVYADGLRHTVVKDMLPGKGDFEEIASIIEQRVQRN